MNNVFPKFIISYVYWILCFLCFVFYSNTLQNTTALDDGLVLIENKYVLKGVAGIPDILSKDAFHSFYGEGNTKGELQGGRWRPLSMITFAVEVSINNLLFGVNKKTKQLNFHYSFSHFINIALYALIICFIFLLLNQYIVPNNFFFAFGVALFFLIHPIHTESVANIKSRDELLSFLFLLLTLIYSFRWLQSLETKRLIMSLLFFILAYLSKENAITLVAILPLSWYFFTDKKIKEIIKKALPYIGITLIYLLLRYYIVGLGSPAPSQEILNNPYLWASVSERWASILSLPLYYFKLLIFPHPLSYDYSYNQLPYQKLSSPLFLLSIVVNAILLILAILLVKKKNILSYAILFFYISYSIVSNIFIDLGATMGERLIFQASLGYCMFIIYLLQEVLSRKWVSERGILSIMGVLVIISFVKTYTRNQDWKNNDTLFIQDVKAAPNSAKATNAAGTAYISWYDHYKAQNNKSKANESVTLAKKYLERSINIHPQFPDPFMNLGSLAWRIGEYKQAEKYWKQGFEMAPNHVKRNEYMNILSQYYTQEGIKWGEKMEYRKAINSLHVALSYNPVNIETCYHLGGIYFTIQQYDSAQVYIAKTLELNVTHPKAREAYNAMKSMGFWK